MRSHVVSVVAVFLAMTVGMLLGNAVLGDDYLVREQLRLAESLEKEFRRLRAENLRYRSEINRLSAALEEASRLEGELFRLAVGGRLGGTTIAIVAIGEVPGRAGLEAAVKDAGAAVRAAKVHLAEAPDGGDRAGWGTAVAEGILDGKDRNGPGAPYVLEVAGGGAVPDAVVVLVGGGEARRDTVVRLVAEMRRALAEKDIPVLVGVAGETDGAAWESQGGALAYPGNSGARLKVITELESVLARK